MKTKIRRTLENRKRRVRRRLLVAQRREDTGKPTLSSMGVRLEIGERVRAFSSGGVAVANQTRCSSRPSSEGAAAYLDRAVTLCRRAGFTDVLLRGDTDFSQTRHLDRWTDDGVRCVFGYLAAKALKKRADQLDAATYDVLERQAKRAFVAVDKLPLPTAATQGSGHRRQGLQEHQAHFRGPGGVLVSADRLLASVPHRRPAQEPQRRARRERALR